MNKKEVKKALTSYERAAERYNYSDNNWKYIRSLNCMKMYLDRFYNLLPPEERLNGEFAATYEALFYTGCGFSQYDRINNTILEYNYGYRPF